MLKGNIYFLCQKKMDGIVRIVLQSKKVETKILQKLKSKQIIRKIENIVKN